MSACPICGKTVDPLRAPAVKVRDGKVIAFCSSACAQLGESRPTAVPQRVRTPVAGIPTGMSSLESGPVIEIVHEPASGVVTSARDERIPAPPIVPSAVDIRETKPKRGSPTADTLDKWTLSDEQVSEREKARASTPLPIAPGRSPLPLILLLVVLVGVGGFLAYRYLIAQPDVPAKPSVTAETGSAAVVVVADASVDAAPTDAVGRARATLETYLASDSPRVQRVAAAALARTGDAKAIDVLATALGKEASDVAKLEISYALARAGDKRGSDALATAATSGRSRDVRAEAARLLALLGDTRAVPTLSNFLDVSQLRLGAAEQLAYVADPKAIKVLDSIRLDDKASPDDRARATIALGIAGRKDVAGALQALLTDARFNAFAAVALAGLHDPTARSVLIHHLDIPSLRVGAARALRILDPALDPTAHVKTLATALGSGKDTEQVQVAEAMLLVAGPVEWSKYP